MFTVPDQPDAVATCPAFSPVGPNPQGFFADCNPAQGFAGTRPVAEHFNELILNLHALLVKGGVTAVKADPTMLWRAVLNVPVIAAPVTVYVTPTGSATPVNPFGGDPFNSVAAALSYLYPYLIVAPNGLVTISVAAGTYAHTAALQVRHPTGGLLDIVGAGVGQTILSFATSHGLQIEGSSLGRVANLTIRGSTGASSDYNGIYVRNGAVGVDTITIEQFKGSGIWAEGARLGLLTGAAITLDDNVQNGLFATAGTTIGGSGAIVANRNLGNANVGLSGCSGVLQSVTTTGGARGVWLNAGANVYIVTISVGAVSIGTDAVAVSAHSALLCPSGAAPNTWAVSTGQSFNANGYGYINGGVALATANRPQCTPAVNTTGNINSYIYVV
jgi:hypothetical protein